MYITYNSIISSFEDWCIRIRINSNQALCRTNTCKMLNCSWNTGCNIKIRRNYLTCLPCMLFMWSPSFIRNRSWAGGSCSKQFCKFLNRTPVIRWFHSPATWDYYFRICQEKFSCLLICTGNFGFNIAFLNIGLILFNSCFIIWADQLKRVLRQGKYFNIRI